MNRMTGLLIVLLLAISIATSVAQPSDILLQKASDGAAIIAIAEQRGNVRIIVEFAPLLSVSEMTPDQVVLESVKKYVRETQDKILIAHFGRAPGFDRALQRAEISPMFAINVNKIELESLASDPLVLRIHHDRPEPANLLNTVSIIQMNQPSGGAYALGATGAGQAVAIVDTGVQSSHPFITASKVTAEACFSTTNAVDGSTSLCRYGSTFDSGTGAGINCTGAFGCDHGTHVAGIAAGKNTSPNSPPGSPFNGIAKEAKIVSVKVFSHFNSVDRCGGLAKTPCVLSYRMDQIRALDWLYQNASWAGAKLAAVNISIGAGQYYSACDSDPRSVSIYRLKSIGVATVIAAGNDYWADAVNAPACISFAVTVASSTKSDAISIFSNMAQIVDLLAPGGSLTGNALDIYSSIPSNAYAYKAGTSMAAPHVAGAFAAIRSVHPNATVDQLEKGLADTGVPITDKRSNGITKPRIRVDLATKAVGGANTLQVSPGTNIASVGQKAGPFSPSSFEYLLSASAGSLDYDITKPDWLDASSTSGKLTVSPTAVTFRINAAANILAPGAYPDTITFTNLTNGLGTQTRSATLTVTPKVTGSLRELPNLPGYRLPTPLAVTSGGMILGATCSPKCVALGGRLEPVRWVQGSPILFELPPRSVGGLASAASSDGSLIVGTVRSQYAHREAFVWRILSAAATSTGGIGFPPGYAESEAKATSADGSIIVGRSWGQKRPCATVWVNGSGNCLPLLHGYTESDAKGVSANGSVIVGSMSTKSGKNSAVRWSSPGPQAQILDPLPGYNACAAFAVTPDGSVIVGGCGQGSTAEAFRWSNGVMQGLGALGEPSLTRSQAIAVSDDGNVITGTALINGASAGFRWTSSDHMKSIRTLLTEAGVDVGTWTGFEPTAISPDGSWIVGSGSTSGSLDRGVIIHLPPEIARPVSNR